MASRLSERNQRLFRSFAALAVCLAGLGGFAWVVERHYPVGEWLVWRVLPVIGYALFLNAASVSIGALVLRRLLGERELPALERLVFSIGLGLITFVLGLYVLGFLGLFNAWAAVALPTLLFALGVREARRLVAELWAWRESVPPPAGRTQRVAQLLVLALGAVYIAFLYLVQLDVSTINFDATWYHFAIAQDYARLGRIVPFLGEKRRAYPHLTSMLHTWALLVPGLSRQAQHWMLSLHLEFAIVLWRIVGVAALARFALGGRDVRGLWVGFFLFPSVFIADQAIGGSADHFLGFFAAPIALAAARALREFERRECLVLGALVGGHILVKYQAAYMLVAVGLAVLVRATFLVLRRLVQQRRQGSAQGTTAGAIVIGGLCIALGAAVVSAPHFAKNAAFYGNPLHPMLQSKFSSSHAKPTPGYYDEGPETVGFIVPYSGLRRQAWVAQRLFQYSFDTSNRDFTRNRPYMGSLFSLLLPCLLLVPRRRVAFVAALGVAAFWVWANVAPNDRYLLSFLDLFIAVTLALLVLVWELGLPARAGLVPLVAFQLLWGGDAMLFYSNTRVKAAMDLIASGYAGKYDDRRFNNKLDERRVTEATPRDAVILGRNYKDLLGLDRTVLSDIPGDQNLINYSRVPDARAFYEQLKARGVTHLLYPKGRRKPFRWNSVILWHGVFQYADKRRTFGALQLAELPRKAPPSTQPTLVALAGIPEYPDGIYRVEQLDIDSRDPRRYSPRPRPLEPIATQDVDAQLRRLQALVLRGRSSALRKARAFADFELVEKFGSEEVYMRKTSRPAAP